MLSVSKQVVLVGTPLLLGAVFANLIPDGWGRSSGPLAGLTQLLTSIVPSINAVARLSEFPGVAETYLAVAWSAVPVMVALMLRMKGLFKIDHMGELRHKVGFVCLALLFLSPLVLLPIFWPAGPNDLVGPTPLAVVSRAVSESRTVLGMVGALVCWGCAVGIALTLAIVKNFPYMFLGKHR